jgi:hypothetical protein
MSIAIELSCFPASSSSVLSGSGTFSVIEAPKFLVLLAQLGVLY